MFKFIGLLTIRWSYMAVKTDKNQLQLDIKSPKTAKSTCYTKRNIC